MKYLLDSNIVIKLTMDLSTPLRRRAGECDADDMVTSAIALAEVYFGSANEKPPPVKQLAAFLERVEVLTFDSEAAKAYATIPFKRGSFDRLIAAHALSRGLTVITDNVKHFADLPGLKVENWAQ